MNAAEKLRILRHEPKHTLFALNVRCEEGMRSHAGDVCFVSHDNVMQPLTGRTLAEMSKCLRAVLKNTRNGDHSTN
jgi:hypothetical protein